MTTEELMFFIPVAAVGIFFLILGFKELLYGNKF